jgi:hypothetical protein
VDEVSITFTQSDFARMFAAINWLFGYVNGTGAEIPNIVIKRLSPISEAAGFDMGSYDRKTGERVDDECHTD